MLSNTSPVEVFLSYCEQDAKMLEELRVSLRLLERDGIITTWYDKMIEPGREKDAEIMAHLQSAGIILLLVSTRFLGSDYDCEVEVQAAMKRHDSNGARVIPIILRECMWRTAPFHKLQVLPSDERPITKWEDRDAAFVDVAKGIEKAAAGLANRETVAPGCAASRPEILPEPPGMRYYIASALNKKDIESRYQVNDPALEPSDDRDEVDLIVFDLSHPPLDWQDYIGGRLTTRESLLPKTVFVAFDGIREPSSLSILELIQGSYGIVCEQQRDLPGKIRNWLSSREIRQQPLDERILELNLAVRRGMRVG